MEYLIYEISGQSQIRKPASAGFFVLAIQITNPPAFRLDPDATSGVCLDTFFTWLYFFGARTMDEKDISKELEIELQKTRLLREQVELRERLRELNKRDERNATVNDAIGSVKTSARATVNAVRTTKQGLTIGKFFLALFYGAIGFIVMGIVGSMVSPRDGESIGFLGGIAVALFFMYRFTRAKQKV